MGPNGCGCGGASGGGGVNFMPAQLAGADQVGMANVPASPSAYLLGSASLGLEAIKPAANLDPGTFGLGPEAITGRFTGGV